MSNYKRDFKGIWIPKEIWLSEDLTMQEKLFLVEIDSLDNEQNCYASNGHFSDFFDLSKGRCSQIISSLQDKGYIDIEYKRNGKQVQQRVIKILRGGIKYSKGGIKNPKGGYLENDKGNNTYTNNTSNKEIVASKLDDSYPDSCEYLSDAEELANLLLDRICYWDPTHSYKNKSKPNKSWILEIERAMRIDGRSKDQLEFIIEYLFTQSTDIATFWAPNVQSGKKLRSKFDKIKNQIKKDHNHEQRTKVQSVIDSMYETPASTN